MAWGVVWSAIFGLSTSEQDRYPALRETLIRDAFNYLERTDREVDPARWAVIWSKLQKLMGDSQPLVDLALHAMPRFEAETSFQKRVLVQLFHDHQDDRHFDEEIVVPWLERVAVTNTWITTFALYRHALTEAAVEKGKQFLRSGDNRFGSWPILWRILQRYEDGKILDDAAIAWLHAVSPKTKAWPALLLEMLERRPSDKVLFDLANRYVELGWNGPMPDAVRAVAEAADRRSSVERPQGRAKALGLPTYNDIEAALLQHLNKVGAVVPAKVYGPLADEFALDFEQRTTSRPDNSTPVWNNRVQWARRALKDKGYLSPRLRVWELNDAGVTAALNARLS